VKENDTALEFRAKESVMGGGQIIFPKVSLEKKAVTENVSKVNKLSTV